MCGDKQCGHVSILDAPECRLTLALSGGAMTPNIPLLFDRPLERVVRQHLYTRPV
jgi:hypothetical protein